MDTLWSDRNRKVLADAARQQRLDQLDETPAARPLHQLHVAARMLAAVALPVGPRKRNAPGVPA
jgi:hypothetical protein